MEITLPSPPRASVVEAAERALAGAARAQIDRNVALQSLAELASLTFLGSG